jgi:hypothetical protein
LLSKLLDQASTSGKTLRRLIEVYLRDFDPHAPGINEAAAKIRRELEKGGPLLDTWCVAQEEVKLFDPTRGPTSLAACLLEPGEQIQEILTRYKLDRPLLAEGKYMLAVEDAVRARVAEMLREAAKMGLDRVLQILARGAAFVSLPAWLILVEPYCAPGSMVALNQTRGLGRQSNNACCNGLAILG